MPNPFGAGTRQWARRTVAKIVTATDVLGAGELLVDEQGAVYGGDGATQIKNLSALAKSTGYFLGPATGDAATDTEALAAAAASGKATVHVTPSATAYNNTADIVPAAGQVWNGNGATIKGHGFRPATGMALRYLHLDANGDSTVYGVHQRPNETAATGWIVEGCTFTGGHQNAIYLDQPSDGTITTDIVIRNCLFTGFTYGVHGVANRAVIEGNQLYSTAPAGAVASSGICLTAGQYNRIVGNHIGGNMWTGISYVARADLTPLYPFMHNTIVGNVIEGVTQEAISLDCDASTGDWTSLRESDTVSSVSVTGATVTVTLAAAGWASITSPYAGYWAVFASGALAGVMAKITAQSHGVLTLDMRPEEAWQIQAGDAVLIGCPAAHNTISGNTIDASATTTFAVAIYGLALYNAITGNTFRGQHGQGGIVVTTLAEVPTPTTTGPASGASVTTTGRIALSAYNSVVGNTGARGPIADVYRQTPNTGAGGNDPIAILPVGNTFADNASRDGFCYSRDTFARPDSSTDIGLNDCRQYWGVDGTWGIKNNQAYLVANGVDGATLMGAQVETGRADGVITARIATPAEDVGIVFRSLNGNSTWFATCTGLYKVVGGTRTTVTTWTTLTGTPLLEVRMQGELIEVWNGATLLAAVTDNFHQTITQHGIGAAPGTAGGSTGQIASWKFAPLPSVTYALPAYSYDGGMVA